MTILRKILDAPYALAASVAVATMLPQQAHAEGEKKIGDIATTVFEQLGALGKLVVGGAVLGGVILVATGLLKLKQAAESNGQVKYADGLWRVVIGAALVAVPAFTGSLAATFGLNAVSIDQQDKF